MAVANICAMLYQEEKDCTGFVVDVVVDVVDCGEVESGPKTALSTVFEIFEHLTLMRPTPFQLASYFR